MNEISLEDSSSIATLVYHQDESISRFDETLVDIARSCSSRPLYLATPYFSVIRLQRYSRLATSFKLITDAQAALKAASPQERATILRFFDDNKGNCKTSSGLHAKVFSGPTRMLIGSANLTDSGFLKNTEMSVRIDDQYLVDECRKWFELKWQLSTIPDLEELAVFSEQIFDDLTLGAKSNVGQGIKKDMVLTAREQCSIEGGHVYQFSGHGFNASGCKVSGKSFLVFAGSEARSTTTDAFDKDSRYADYRRFLIDSKVLELRSVRHLGGQRNGFREFEEKRLVFVKDHRFSSWSRAASIVGGNLRSGPECWT